MERGLESSFYEELLPLAFPAYRLQPNPYGSNDLGRYFPGSTNGFDPYTVLALGASANVDAIHPSPGLPPASALQRMFSPLDKGGDLTVGGLGMEPVDFFLNASVRDYGPHDPFGSNCSWLS